MQLEGANDARAVQTDYRDNHKWHCKIQQLNARIS